MKTSVVAVGCGVAFGAALAVSGAANPRNILGFLDVAGDFRPQLIAVMGVAVALNLAIWARVLRRGRPYLAGTFALPTRSDVDAQLIAGSCLFGIGWGLSGYCVGPALTSLVASTSSAALYLAAVVGGYLIHAFATAPRGT